MRIGLWSLEPQIENTALMQISQYHKQQGDSVEWYSPLFSYDKVYVSSLFSFTKKPVLRSNMVAGGTGFNVTSRLPKEIEESDLDYSIYPKCKTSYLWFSRGCKYNHSFCVVPNKEGAIHAVTPKNLNPKGKAIDVMDNSFFDGPDWKDAIGFLKDQNKPLVFHGINARTFSEENGSALRELKRSYVLHPAWDDPRENMIPLLGFMKSQVPKTSIRVYVLIGFWSTPEQDLDRVTKIRELDLDPWVMPFNKQDPYQKAFTRWCNRHPGCEWEDYSYGSWVALNDDKNSRSS